MQSPWSECMCVTVCGGVACRHKQLHAHRPQVYTPGEVGSLPLARNAQHSTSYPTQMHKMGAERSHLCTCTYVKWVGLKDQRSLRTLLTAL